MDPSELHKERQWLHALACNDEKAFTFIYNEYWQFLFSVAYNTTRSKEVAQEIVQEVFVSLWVNRQHATVQSTLKGYLAGAIRNKVFDYFDKLKVRERYKHVAAMELPQMINSTEEAIAFDEISALVNQQIEKLPETTRKIFILSRFRGNSIPEISKELSLSVKTVEYHLTKALKFLRPRLAEYTPPTTEPMVFLILMLA